MIMQQIKFKAKKIINNNIMLKFNYKAKNISYNKCREKNGNKRG